MPMFTQAAQLRLSQRPPDAGSRITPEIVVERSLDASEWVDASEEIEIVGATMTSVGGMVTFAFAANVLSDYTSAYMFRISFPEREDTITVPQRVGELTLVNQTTDRYWSVYDLVGVPEGRLEALDPLGHVWPTLLSGDIIQAHGAWFI